MPCNTSVNDLNLKAYFASNLAIVGCRSPAVRYVYAYYPIDHTSRHK